MEKYDFDTFPERRSTESLKWRYFDEDVLPMWVADMDFTSPSSVIQALRQRVEHGIFGYPLTLADVQNQFMELHHLIVERLLRLYNWKISPEDLVFIPGVVTGFNLACHMLPHHRSGVLIQTPVYQPILKAAEKTDRKYQDMPLAYLPDGSIEISWEKFEESITSETGLFILCNPHNPIGKVFNQDELERMGEICLRNGILICSDEIHCDLIFSESRHIPIASLDPEIANRTITLMAPSKTYNIAGLQTSYTIIQNPELRRQYLASKQGLVPWVNLMGLVAAEAAYRGGGDWLSQLMDYLQANRDFLYDYVLQYLPGIRMNKPQGTYLAWLDCRDAGIEGKACDFFIQNGRVAFNDGATFGKGWDKFVRLNFGCPHAMLVEALDRMGIALEATATGDPLVTKPVHLSPS